MDGKAGAADVHRFLKLSARRYSSASWAKAIDDGSCWTRRRRLSIRGLSDTAYGTVTLTVAKPTRLSVSFTLRVTEYVPGPA